MSRDGGISGGISVFDENCGARFMFPGCQATPLAFHAWKEVFVPLGLKGCSRQEAVKYA